MNLAVFPGISCGSRAPNVLRVYEVPHTPVKRGARDGSASALPHHEQLTANRLLARDPPLRIGLPPVVHIHPARLHQAARLALRRRQPDTRDQIDNRHTGAVELVPRRSDEGTSSNTASTSSTGNAVMSSPKSSVEACAARAACSAPCTSVGDFGRQRPLRLAFLGLGSDPRRQRLDAGFASRNVNSFRCETTSRSSVFSQN